MNINEKCNVTSFGSFALKTSADNYNNKQHCVLPMWHNFQNTLQLADKDVADIHQNFT